MKTLKRIFFMALLIAFVANVSACKISPTISSPRQSDNLELLLWDSSEIVAIKTRVAHGDPDLKDALDRLRKEADAAVRIAPLSVMDKKGVPPSGNRHDYMSLSIYYWPDPNEANGMPYIRRDGEVNPESNSDYYDKASLSHMVSAVTTLSLAYYYTGDEQYSAHAAKLLKTWFLDPATQMNPNLQYAQGIPGKNSGEPGGIIDSVGFLDVVDDASFLQGSNNWTSSDQKALESWFRAYLIWLQDSAFGKAESAATNNHGTWYDTQIAAFALFTGQVDLATGILKSTVPGRIESQIEPDGRQLLELSRTRSLHYSLYNLEAFVSLSMLGEHLGIDLWHYSTSDGRSIGKALEFVLPGLNGSQWEYPEIGSQDYSSFASYLCRASKYYPEQNYLSTVDKLLGDTARSSRLNLLCSRR